MTKDDIVIMARAAGVRDDGHRFEFSEYKHLERFAALVAEQEREAGDMVVASMQVYVDRHHAVTLKMIERSAEKEREACAKLCEAQGEYGWQQYADAIRARGTT
jgi:hypothetical protein